MYELEYLEEFFEDLKRHKKSGDLQILQKIDSLLDELEKHPTFGTGKPEQLKWYGQEYVYSRRLDKKHRLTYRILEEEKVVKIMTCYGHYGKR